MEDLLQAKGARGHDDLNVQLFGWAVGARAIWSAPRAGIKALLIPVEYIRCAEFRYVLQQLAVERSMDVLDISSPKFLSLYLAARVGAKVTSTDLVDYFVKEYAAYARVAGVGDNFSMACQDARNLTFADNSFDRVYSISAVEHIPGDGDRRAMLEIARVLRPGGVAAVTVPFSRPGQGYVEVFGRQYWTDSDDAFDYRSYDSTTLRHRLLDGVPLQLLDLSFWGERRIPVEDTIIHHRLPIVLKWALFPLHLPLSRLFVSRLEENGPGHKKVACLTLRKPT